MAKEKKEMSRLSIILMGEEWTGKSSVGNTMLGQSVFKVDTDTEHVTHRLGIIEGRNVTVVDTPGWISDCYPDIPLKTLKQGNNSVSFMCQGFHILLLTIPISQDQNWNQKLVQRLSNALSLFNADIWKHTMLLFTRYDLLDSKGFEQYLEGNGQAFQSLVEKCEQRYHVLNNRKCNDRKQVRELMEKIEQIVQVNDGQLLQLVTSEQGVGTLRENEMDTLRLNEQLKMDEPIRGESCFRLEDYMFKSLRPEGNEPQNPTEQKEMSHPADMQNAAPESSYIQNEYTKPTPDLCSESPAEINRGLSRSSGDNRDPDASTSKKNTCTEVEEACMDRDGDGDKEKNKKHVQHTTLQKYTPHPWDDVWDLNITCSFYNVVSNHQQIIVTCILQISVCWRKIKPSCQTEWISFTVYGDNLQFIMILYLFVTYLILSYKTYGVHKETGVQTMNTLVSGFVDHQQEPGKETQGVFHSLLRHIVSNMPKRLDGEITKCSKMVDVKKIPQHSTGGNNEEMKQSEDEVLLQHIQKGEELRHVQKYIEDDKLLQHIWQSEDDEELPQHGKKDEEDEELPLHIHKDKEKDKELPQHVYKHDENEELTQHVQDYDDEKLPQTIHKGEEEDAVLLQHVHKGNEDDQLTQPGQKCREDDEELTQHGQKVEEDEALPQHFYKGVEGHDEELLQHFHKGEEDEQLTQHGQKCRDDDEELTQHIHQGDEQLTQHFYKGVEEHDEELPYVQKYDKEDEEAFQPISQGDEDEQLIHHGQKGKEDEELTQHGQKSEDDALPQHFYKCVEEHDEELPYVEKYHKEDEVVFQNIRQGEEEEELPQPSHKDEGEELPQPSQKAECEELLQHIHKENEKDEDELPQHGETEQPQSTDKGEEEKSPKIKGVNEAISHQSKRGHKKEPPQQDYKEDDENMLQQKKRAVDDHTLQHSIKEEEKQMLQNNKRDYEVKDQQRNEKRYLNLRETALGVGMENGDTEKTSITMQVSE
ncbi:neurofilament medium polypeptide-like isoform X2 [Tachysurus fulvidraco]|uniref:neurofilament medium polypeptide-like isoform X2 n=1 Tax=Tachysurus fulvidraco TaxID=1234273 RepID=UPI001FEE7E1D|nr:neurofilament medium polypeptide-like isoform X2 [Tachysurus fulvidraco]